MITIFGGFTYILFSTKMGRFLENQFLCKWLFLQCFHRSFFSKIITLTPGPCFTYNCMGTALTKKSVKLSRTFLWQKTDLEDTDSIIRRILTGTDGTKGKPLFPDVFFFLLFLSFVRAIDLSLKPSQIKALQLFQQRVAREGVWGDGFKI
jgi:hypothetical protein